MMTMMMRSIVAIITINTIAVVRWDWALAHAIYAWVDSVSYRGFGRLAAVNVNAFQLKPPLLSSTFGTPLNDHINLNKNNRNDGNNKYNISEIVLECGGPELWTVS
jgi:hypothetical protein